MIGILLAFALAQQPDHSPKPCVVKEVVTEGVRSDCHGWKPAKGEKMYAPAEVNKQLRVGDTFYFVWKDTRWVAQLSETVAIVTVDKQPAEIILKSEAEAQFTKLCEGDVSLVFDGGTHVITLKRIDAERALADPNAVIDSIQGIIKPSARKLTAEEIQNALKATIESNDKRLRALAAALNPMPDWPQFVLNNEPSVCNRNPKPLPLPKL